MNIQRGDIVLVDYPYTLNSETKVRPVLVIFSLHITYKMQKIFLQQSGRF